MDIQPPKKNQKKQGNVNQNFDVDAISISHLGQN